MKTVLFYHSLLSDWNHGNAHFLRGVVKALQMGGHEVVVMEPEHNWSLENLLAERGEQALLNFSTHYPTLKSTFYDTSHPELEQVLTDADLVIAHEWNEPFLIEWLGKRKKQFKYKLLFHDTHHRAVSEEEQMKKYDLTNYDGVLAFGEVLKEIYLKKGWAKHVWVWHEAADTTLFHPIEKEKEGDLVWVGNWGDEERTAELHEFLIKPVKELGLTAKVYGVRYPDEALKSLKEAGISYGGYLPSYEVPAVFAAYKFTVHVPRKFYTKSLPGIPTIRPFEALACGIPLISAPWSDSEGLFMDGVDYLSVGNGEEMKMAMKHLLHDPESGKELAVAGLKTICSRHTCEHRINQLMAIYEQLCGIQTYETII